MLIENGKFNLEFFKENYKNYRWLRLPRKLGVNHTEHFYVGLYEDDSVNIKIKVRPSMRMDVTESLKNMNKFGKPLPEGSKERPYEFGSTVEVIIDAAFIEKIAEVATDDDKDKIQKVSW